MAMDYDKPSLCHTPPQNAKTCSILIQFSKFFILLGIRVKLKKLLWIWIIDTYRTRAIKGRALYSKIIFLTLGLSHKKLIKIVF